jgi:hypothetical protein
MGLSHMQQVIFPLWQRWIEGLSDNSSKALYVILSEAKNLLDPSTYTFEILRPLAADSE